MPTMLIDHVSAWAAQTNCWVLARGPGEPALVVDAPPELEPILEMLRRHRLIVAGIVLTHGHVDHAAGAAGLQDATGSRAWIHPDDDFLSRAPEDQLRMLFGMRPPGDYRAPIDPTPIADGDELTIAGFAVEVLHTPGHTPGHVCLAVEGEGMVFSGDQLFAGSVGRTDLPGGSHTALMESMRAKVLTLDDSTRVLPGHGPETTIGRERRTNPFLTGLV